MTLPTLPTLPTAPTISVIICAYTEERWEDVNAAVESIQQQSLVPLEIILVIDHNTQLLERMRAHRKDVIAIENSEPRGLSGARNSGIAIAKGDYLAFLDDDAVAELDWLERLCRCCQDEEVLGAGGIVEPLWLKQRPSWFPSEFYWVVGCTYAIMSNEIHVVRNPFGGCMCVRREVFEVVGGFKNGIGRVGSNSSGGEETELCIRATHHWPDKVFLCDPKARIHHRISPKRASWRYFLARCYAEGLSKAQVSRSVGMKDGLSSESAYIRKNLTHGMIRGLSDALLRKDITGLSRVGAIIGGLWMTVLGYAVGTIKQITSPSVEETNAGAVSSSVDASGVDSSLRTITAPK